MTGCWTCRTRKKKCNQAFPSCSECMRLGICCDGYGKRPSWADGGMLEAKYKRQLKDHIRRKAKHRRSDSLPQPNELTPPLTESGDAEVDSADIFDAHFVGFLNDSSILGSDFDTPLIELAIPQSGSTSSSSQSPDRHVPCQFAVGEDLSLSLLVRNDIETSASLGPSNHQGASRAGEMPEMRQCEALVHYLDHIYWKQFPACNRLASSIDRTWILFSSMNSTISRKAVTGLSATITATAITSLRSDDRSRKLDGMYDIQEGIAAIVASQSSQGQADIQSLLLAVSTITYHALVLGSSISLNELLSTTQDILQLSTGQGSDNEGSKNMLENALSFTLAQAIYIDTHHAATQRSTCVLDDSSLRKLSLITDTSTEEAYGCPLWILETLRRITKLDTWKQEHSKKGRLSVPELVSRSTKLLELLTSKTVSRRSSASSEVSININGHHEEMALRMPGPGVSASKNLKDVIAQLYINAACIYLRVIVSGANPHLSEIQTLVESSLNLLYSLRALDIFPCVVWPLMVTTCLAAGERREDYRFIILRVAEQEQLRYTFTSMLDLAQECWRLSNESPLMQWDWTMAMKNLGLPSCAFILPI